MQLNRKDTLCYVNYLYLKDPTEICDELGLCNTTKKAVQSVVQHSQPQVKEVFIPAIPAPLWFSNVPKPQISKVCYCNCKPY